MDHQGLQLNTQAEIAEASSCSSVELRKLNRLCQRIINFVVEYLEHEAEVSKAYLLKVVTGKRADLIKALNYLVEQHKLEQIGSGGRGDPAFYQLPIKVQTTIPQIEVAEPQIQQTEELQTEEREVMRL